MTRWVQFLRNGREQLGSEGRYIPDGRYGIVRIAEEAKNLAYKLRHVSSSDCFEIRIGDYKRDSYTVLYREELTTLLTNTLGKAYET